MTQLPHKPTDTQSVEHTALDNIDTARTLIMRRYLAELQRYPVQEPDSSAAQFNAASDLRIFRVERLVQDNKQSVIESLMAAYTSLGAAGYSVFLLLDSDGKETRLYIGAKGEPGRTLGHNAGTLLRETFRGHFPGSALTGQNARETDELLQTMRDQGDIPSTSITAVTGVPSLSTEDREHFVQGLERFIDAAEGRKYQAILLAESVSPAALDAARLGYEQVATQLSPLLKQQISYGEQESESVGLNVGRSLNETMGTSLSLTESVSQSFGGGTSRTETTGTFDSKTVGVSVNIGASNSLSGTISASVQAGCAFFGGAVGASIGKVVGRSIGIGGSTSKTTGTSSSTSVGTSDNWNTSSGQGTGKTENSANTTGTNENRSKNITTGNHKQYSIEIVDKGIEQLLGKINHHLGRLDEAKTYGGWNAAAYFIAENTAASESLASLFLGLVRGNRSAHEDFALTTWFSHQKKIVLGWLGSFNHPKIRPQLSENISISALTPGTLVSGKEMAILLSLPRKSTSTVAVMKVETFGRAIQNLDGRLITEMPNDSQLTLGHIRHLWETMPQKISLNFNQISGHVFVTGSTGSGKSNALYLLLQQLSDKSVPFLVIEPAKGEYKHVFGKHEDVKIFGTNSAFSPVLKINPFCFPESIHVLEHIDRLVEIFNMCWPMYAAMPAVLKEAMLQAYEDFGWDLERSCDVTGKREFPTFEGLSHALESVLDESLYSTEVKGNYTGALMTRVRSLMNGLNGEIFSSEEIDNSVLFDSSVIVDLSRVGSAETKALIMGILVMRLTEHRLAEGGMNRKLRHVTVLEEAHNILPASPVASNSESAGIGQKSVELLSNAIAEMRTYGEGFIIVDQSPHAVDISAIRNTNTKIVLRLPEEQDRQLAGKSMGLKDEQIDELARLANGVAVVFQNNWVEPVACQIDFFQPEKEPYSYVISHSCPDDRKAESLRIDAVNFLVSARVPAPYPVDLDRLKEEIGGQHIWLTPVKKQRILAAISQKQRGCVPALLNDDLQQPELTCLIADLLNIDPDARKKMRAARIRVLLHRGVPGLDKEAAECVLKLLLSQKGGDL